MHDIKRFTRWFAAFIIILLMIPTIQFYDVLTSPLKVNRVTEDFNHLTEHYVMHRDITGLVASARAYALHTDNRYLDDFDELSVVVVTRAMDLYNKAHNEAEREAVKNIIDLTEAYVSCFRNEVVPLVEAGSEDYRELFREKCESLASELQNTSQENITASHKDQKRGAAGMVAMENSIWFFSAFLVVASLVLLYYGVRQIILPMLLRHHQLENIAELTGDAIIVTDRQGKVAIINRTAENLLQISAREIDRGYLTNVMVRYPALQNLLQPLLGVALNGAKELNNQVVFFTRGQKMLLNADYYPRYSLRGVSGAIMVARPVEIHKDKRYLFDAIEAERKKISIEIHDWVGRNMSAIIHSLDFMLKTGTGKVAHDLHSDLVKLRSQCQGAVMDMRGIMNDIHPYLIDKVGLLAALESYVTRFEQLHGIKVYIFYQNRVLSLGKPEEIIVYRIIQEALTNVVKHSDAGEVDIYFKEADGTLQVEIVDDGAPPEEMVMGSGMWGMKERANLIGGDLVCNGQDNGFAVTLTVPVTLEGGTDEPGKNNAG